MQAQPNRTYALILDNKCHQIFTRETLIEWNENDIETTDITDYKEDVYEHDLWNAETQKFSWPDDLSLNELTRRRKKVRQREVDNIKVTTAAGNTFDGDEIAQGRMARAILGLQTQPDATVNWVLANNTVVSVTAAELSEALALAGIAQAELWSKPYDPVEPKQTTTEP